MSKCVRTMCKLRIWIDTGGQDLVEYALLAGFVAVASGVFFPNVTASMSTIYSRLASKLAEGSG